MIITRIQSVKPVSQIAKKVAPKVSPKVANASAKLSNVVFPAAVAAVTVAGIDKAADIKKFFAASSGCESFYSTEMPDLYSC